MLVRGQTKRMSPPYFVFKMINGLLLIVPSQAYAESMDIFHYAPDVNEMMTSKLILINEMSQTCSRSHLQ